MNLKALFLFVLLALLAGVITLNIAVLYSTFADLQFRSAADPITQELILRAERGEWGELLKLCEIGHVIVRPSGYARCSASMRGDLSVTVWRERPLAAYNLLGTVQVQMTEGKNEVLEIQHKRGV